MLYLHNQCIYSVVFGAHIFSVFAVQCIAPVRWGDEVQLGKHLFSNRNDVIIIVIIVIIVIVVIIIFVIVIIIIIIVSAVLGLVVYLEKCICSPVHTVYSIHVRVSLYVQ